MQICKFSEGTVLYPEIILPFSPKWKYKWHWEARFTCLCCSSCNISINSYHIYYKIQNSCNIFSRFKFLNLSYYYYSSNYGIYYNHKLFLVAILLYTFKHGELIEISFISNLLYRFKRWSYFLKIWTSNNSLADLHFWSLLVEKSLIYVFSQKQ